MPPSIIPYRHLLRLGCLKRNYICHLSTTPICLEDANAVKQELLSDQRLQAMVAELEKSANLQQGNDILLESIETLKPSQEVITAKELDKLVSVFENSFSVRQLAQYSAVHHLPRNKRKKRQLIDGIVKKHWGIQTVEEYDAAREQEALERRKDLVKETFPASFQEMFFIIGSNGDTIRTIEEDHQVLITIDVEKKEYTVEGPSKAVVQAKKEILTHLNIIQEEVDAPKGIKENTQLKNEVNESLVDVSKLAGSFITLEKDKFSLASTSTENLMNAKRLLNLMLTEVKKRRPCTSCVSYSIYTRWEQPAKKPWIQQIIQLYINTWNTQFYQCKTPHRCHFTTRSWIGTNWNTETRMNRMTMWC